MAVIPTYETKVGLDPATKGMPKPVLSGAEESAAYAGAQALQGVGRALAGFGNELFDHMERRAAEKDNFNDKLQRSALDNDIQGLVTKKQQEMKPDGSDLVSNTMPDLDKLAQQRMAQMSDRNRERFQQAWGVEKQKWQLELAGAAKKQENLYQSNEIDKSANSYLTRIERDPSQASALIEEQASLIRNSSLPVDVKLKAEEAWKSRAQEFATTAAARGDPRRMRELLGMPPEDTDNLPSVSGLRMKGAQATGGGDAHAGTTEAMRAIQGAMPELQYFTAVNDHYHKGTTSRHANGLAFDFTVTDGSKSADAANKARLILANKGLKEGTDFTVIDEYKNPSARSTGGHIHVDFKTPEAAARFAGGSAGGRAGGFTLEKVVDRIIGAESRGDATAQNPNSSAGGAGQFIDSTWISMVTRYRPDLAATRSREQILALKGNGDLSREMTKAYAGENVESLKAAGITPTAGRVYLAHFLGPDGAVKVLKADPGTPVSNIVGEAAVSANKSILAGKTAGDVAGWADGKMGGTAVAARPLPAFDTSAIPAEKRWALVKQAAAQERESLAEFQRQSLSIAQQTSLQILQASLGQGSMPSRDSILNNTSLADNHKESLLNSISAAEGKRSETAGEPYSRNFADAAAGKATLIDRSVIENDPNLTESKRNGLLVSHRAAQLGINNTNAQANAAAASAMNENIERMIIEAKRDPSKMFPRALIETNGIVTEAQRNTLLRSYDAMKDEGAKLATAIAQLNSGQLDGTGSVKETKEAVNTIAGSFIPTPASLFEQSPEGEARRARVTQIAQRTGAVPDVAVQMIQSGFNSTDPVRVEAAANLASQIMAANPNAFGSSGARETIQQLGKAFDYYVNTLGMAPREAASKLAEQNDPEWKRKNRKSEDETGAFEKKLRDGDAVNDLRGGFLGFRSADLAFTKEGVRAVESDFIQAARERYAIHGDEDRARKEAMHALIGDPSKGIRGVYAPTWFNGTKTLMRYAPEAAPAYPPLPDGSQDYIYQQAIAHIKEKTGKDVPRDRLILLDTGRNTAEAFRQNLQVPYRLMYTDEKGVVQQAPPNTAVGWVVDYQKAREAFRAKDQAERDRGVGTWATQMGASPAVASDPQGAREFIAAQQAAQRAENDRQARERAPAQAAEIERGRSLARESMANQTPDEIPRAGQIPLGAGNDDARRRMQDEELRRSRELGRGARER